MQVTGEDTKCSPPLVIHLQTAAAQMNAVNTPMVTVSVSLNKLLI
jgi:hypothetical protein